MTHIERSVRTLLAKIEGPPCNPAAGSVLVNALQSRWGEAFPADNTATRTRPAPYVHDACLGNLHYPPAVLPVTMPSTGGRQDAIEALWKWGAITPQMVRLPDFAETPPGYPCKAEGCPQSEQVLKGKFRLYLHYAWPNGVNPEIGSEFLSCEQVRPAMVRAARYNHSCPPLSCPGCQITPVLTNLGYLAARQLLVERALRSG